MRRGRREAATGIPGPTGHPPAGRLPGGDGTARPGPLERALADILDFPPPGPPPSRGLSRPGGSARPDGPSRPGRPGGRAPTLALALSLTGLLVALPVALAVGDAVATGPDRERLRQVLVAEYLARDAARDRLAERVDGLRAQVGELTARERATAEERARLAEQIDTLAPVAGWAQVRGPGIRITLADVPRDDRPGGGPAGSGGARPSGTPVPVGRLADQDVAEVVNLLWSAGAEAVAVNGVRLTSLSAVRAAGDVLLVDLRPVAAPYVIEAVLGAAAHAGDGAAGAGRAGAGERADPRALADRIGRSAVLERLRIRAGAPADPVVVAALDELTVPAAIPRVPGHATGSGA